jgi:sulfur-oxidizing protein SoxB
MNLTKREFIQLMGAGTMAGMSMGRFSEASAATAANGLYDIPKFGNVSFLHMTDCHAQLKPIYFREPSINMGIGNMQGNLPHLVGQHLLQVAKIRPGSAEAHALTFWTLKKQPNATAKWAALRTWPRWSNA